MNIFCRWSMHRPGSCKIFNQGKFFTRCCDCGEDLVETGRGWKTLPRNKKLVWRSRTANDRFFEIIPNTKRARLRPVLLAPFRRRQSGWRMTA